MQPSCWAHDYSKWVDHWSIYCTDNESKQMMKTLLSILGITVHHIFLIMHYFWPPIPILLWMIWTLPFQHLFDLQLLSSLPRRNMLCISQPSFNVIVFLISQLLKVSWSSVNMLYWQCVQEDVKDLVAKHRCRNCAPHLPDNMRLLTICNQQNSQNSCNSSLTNSTVDDLETPILALVQSPAAAQQSTSAPATNIPSMTQPALPIASSTPGTLPENSNPSQLQLYPLSICDIIERAKQFSHCDIAAINSFPLHLDFNNQAVEYINKAIAEHHSRGLPISDGKTLLFMRPEADKDGGPNIFLASWSS